MQRYATLAALLCTATTHAAATTIGGRAYALAAKCPNNAYDLTLKLQRNKVKPAAAVDIVFAASSAKNFYRLSLNAKRAELTSCQAGNVRALASTPTDAIKAGALELLFKRHERSLRIYANGRLLIESFDASHDKGIAAVAPNGWSVQSARCQKRAPIEFGDDFMRSQEQIELAPWTKVSGQWSFHSVTEKHERAKAAYSVNPFTLGGRGGKPNAEALVTAGHEFWDDYRFTVSARSYGGTMGLAYNYRGPQDYWLVRLAVSSPMESSCRMQLVRVLGGKRQVVSTAYVTAALEQWYQLGVETQGARAIVLFDDWPVFDVTNPTARGGKVGLYVAGDKEAKFDDARVEPSHWIRFDHPGALEAGKQWKWRAMPKLEHAATTAKGFTAVAPMALTPTAEQALLRFGGESWKGYVVKARLTFAPKAQWLGLCAGPRLLFRVGPGAKGRWTAQWLDAGKVLAQAPVAAPKSRALDVELDLTSGRVSKAYVDGFLVLRVERVAAGQPGLYASKAQGSTFANLAVGRRLDRDWEKHPGNAIFVKDPFMTNWATTRGFWIPVKGAANTYWHCGDCYGSVRVSAPLQPGITVAVAASKESFASGYQLVASHQAKANGKASAQYALRLLRLGKEVGHARIAPQHGGALAIERDGNYVTVEYGDKEALCYRDPNPLPGTRLGLRADSEIDFANIAVRRDHVLDYLFETAPWEWTQTGLWEVTNRFACYPIWTHMNGRSLGDALLWNKFRFDGDLTVEFYAGLRMRQDTKMWAQQPGSYPRQGDLNATICADGKRLDTGYSFIVYAWDQRWSERTTRILRGGKVAAQTDRHVLPNTRNGSGARASEIPWMPRQGERPIHGAWYYFKARKVGSELSYFCDDLPILTYRDPKPLAGKRVALWTQNNSIVIARVKISYQRRSAPCPLAAPPAAKAARPATFAQVASKTHPGLWCDFEAGVDGWQSTSCDQGALVEWDNSTRSTGAASLRLTNAHTGGDFGVAVPAPKLDALHVAALRFDYKLTPDVRVDLYCRLNGDLHFVQFTGESYSNENVKSLGAIAGVKADGKWHRAEFDLGAAVRRLYPLSASMELTDVRFGSFHEGYLRASIGGNGAGATWHVDNFALATAAAAPAKFTWQGSGAFAVSFDSDGAKPSAPQAAKGKQAAFSPKKSGLHLLRLWRQAGGKWRQVGGQAAFVQIAPLAVASVTPKPGSKWHGEPVRVAFKPSGCRVSSAFALTCNGKRVPINWQTTTYDPTKRTATFDLGRAGLSFANGQRIDCTLQFRESASNPRSGQFKWHYVMDWAGDKLPPSDVTVSGALVHNTFETDKEGWEPASGYGYAKTAIDDSTAAEGKRSLMVFNRIVGGYFGVNVHGGAFNAGKYPLMTFAYKIDPGVATDFVVNPSPSGWQRQIKFTDTSGSLGRLGRVRGVTADGKWHVGEVNLWQAFCNQRYDPQMFHLSSIKMGDFGSHSNGPTNCYHIDDFRIAPVLSAAKGFKLQLAATDPSGIKGYSWHWSAKAVGDADTKLDGTSGELVCKAAPQGKSYLHVRAQDNAGNWGRTTHWAFMIDNAPPKITPTGQWSKGLASASKLTMTLADVGPAGTDPESLAVKVNGKAFALDPLLADFKPARGTLSWEWTLATGLFSKPVANGTVVNVELPAVRDFAGNAAKPFKLAAKVNYGQDKEAPPPPEVACASQPMTCFDTFTRSLGDWANWGGRSAALAFRTYDAKRKQHCVRVVNQTYNSSFGIYVYNKPFDVRKTPWVSFDSNFPKAVKVHFLVYADKKWYAIKLTSKVKHTDKTKTIGAVPGIVADGRWRFTRFNLRDMLDKGIAGGLKDPIVRRITIAAYTSLYNAAGAQFFVDNFAIYGAGSHQPVFNVTSWDPSGIKAYAYWLDTKPHTIPPHNKPVTSGRITLPAVKSPGQYYFHVSAQDGAGHWGEPTHFPYYVATVPKPKPAKAKK